MSATLTANYSFILLGFSPGEDFRWISIGTVTQRPTDDVSTVEPMVKLMLHEANLHMPFRLRYFITFKDMQGSYQDLQKTWRNNLKGRGYEGVSDFAENIDPKDTFVGLGLPVEVLRSEIYNIGLIVQASFSRSSRGKDVTGSILDIWTQKRPVPELENLIHILDGREPLPESAKIPIPQDTADMIVTRPAELKDRCTPEDLSLLFRVSDVEIAESLYVAFVDSILRAPPSDDKTENTFIHFWDNNIAKFLEIILPSGSSLRNTSINTSTRKLRPDYSFLLEGVAPFRGEERGPRCNTKDPKRELGEKLIWTYNPVPYVLGYYAKGAELTYVAICPPGPSEECPKVINLFSTTLRGRADRIKNAVRIIKMSTIIESIAEEIGPQGEREYVELARNDKTIVIGGTFVMKTFEGVGATDRAQWLRSIYTHLRNKNVPNVDHLVYPSTAENSVCLGPKGFAIPPRTRGELLDAVTCVLEAIAVLHSEPTPMIHRDIRWPNIVRSATNSSKWFLIDWEHAAMVPTSAAIELARESHCPKVFEDNHGGEVDVWAVGKLLSDMFFQEIMVFWSFELRDLAEQMMTYELTAEGALAVIQRIKSS